jgi:nucleoside-triphosphatase
MIIELNTHIFLLTGAVHAGKTTRAGMLAEVCRTKGIHVSGFLAPGQFEGPARSGFTLLDLATGEHYPLATIRQHPGWTRYGRFFFDPATMEKGKMAVKRALGEKHRLYIIDEVGPMELEGLGWSDLLDHLASRKDTRQLWLVRENLAGSVAARWRIAPANFLPMEEVTVDTILEKLLGDC